MIIIWITKKYYLINNNLDYEHFYLQVPVAADTVDPRDQITITIEFL